MIIVPIINYNKKRIASDKCSNCHSASVRINCTSFRGLIKIQVFFFGFRPACDSCEAWCPNLCEGTRAIGPAWSLGAPIRRPYQEIRACTVRIEAGKEVIRNGFVPAKALIGGLPMPRPPSSSHHWEESANDAWCDPGWDW